MSRLASAELQAPASGWRERWLSMLDRWLSSPGLYRWSLGNPIGRLIMRRRAAQLFSLMAGFVHSQVLLACVRLGWFEALLSEPRSLTQLQQMAHLPPDSVQRLLGSAISLGLIEQRGQRYGLGPLGVPVAAHAGLRAMIEHNALLNSDLVDPLQLLSRPESSGMHAYWPYPTGDAADARPIADGVDAVATPPISQAQTFSQSTQGAPQISRYSELMARSQRFLIEELLAAYDFTQHRRVLDVGGGQGGWVIALAQRVTHLQLHLFDLPGVAALARQRVAEAGLTQRISCTGGSFRSDALPEGADLITLLRVAHDHADEAVLELLTRIHQALPAGGQLLLAEPMAEPEGKPCASDAYFHFYLLAMGRGRLRTAGELSQLMRRAGFGAIRSIPNPVPLHGSLLLARKD
ncbi:MAG: methyltransferase domain-containing protein [Betaproteobacteria bacterium]|nr:methyltransferase domain-containing protein [Betaproteobacteria bacterium]